jgi:hypothetical protein
MPVNPSAELSDGVPIEWYSIDHGYLSWTNSPLQASSTYTLATSGTVYTVALKVNGGTITNLNYHITTAGATLTSAQNYVGLYQAGALLASSADQSTAWTSTGLTTTALSTPVQVQQGIVIAAFVFNGTTGPTLSASGIYGNEGFAAAASCFGTANTSRTTLPATLGTIAALAKSPWVALS